MKTIQVQREIKFRVWDIQEKTYAKIDEWGKCNPNAQITEEVPNILELISDKVFIWEQYTGWKDVAGKDIYEGDVLKHHGIVAWDNERLGWARIDLGWNNEREWHELNSLTSPFEIIGNIHENPELLSK